MNLAAFILQPSARLQANCPTAGAEVEPTLSGSSRGGVRNSDSRILPRAFLSQLSGRPGSMASRAKDEVPGGGVRRCRTSLSQRERRCAVLDRPRRDNLFSARSRTGHRPEPHYCRPHTRCKEEGKNRLRERAQRGTGFLSRRHPLQWEPPSTTTQRSGDGSCQPTGSSATEPHACWASSSPAREWSTRAAIRSSSAATAASKSAISSANPPRGPSR